MLQFHGDSTIFSFKSPKTTHKSTANASIQMKRLHVSNVKTSFTSTVNICHNNIFSTFAYHFRLYKLFFSSHVWLVKRFFTQHDASFYISHPMPHHSDIWRVVWEITAHIHEHSADIMMSSPPSQSDRCVTAALDTMWLQLRWCEAYTLIFHPKIIFCIKYLTQVVVFLQCDYF